MVICRVDSNLDSVLGGSLGGESHVAAELAVGILRISRRVRRRYAFDSGCGAEVKRTLQLIPDKRDVAVHMRSCGCKSGIGKELAEFSRRLAVVSGELHTVISTRL